jgi:hypothetical protein
LYHVGLFLVSSRCYSICCTHFGVKNGLIPNAYVAHHLLIQ